jgi:hypothetical protein
MLGYYYAIFVYVVLHHFIQLELMEEIAVIYTGCYTSTAVVNERLWVRAAIRSLVPKRSFQKAFHRKLVHDLPSLLDSVFLRLLVLES